MELFQFAHGFATLNVTNVKTLKSVAGNEQIDLFSFLPFNVSRIPLLLQPPPNPPQRIIKLIHDAFFQRNDSVVRDFNAFGTNLRATLGDIAVTDSLRVPQFLDAILRVEWVHLQSGDMN